MLKKKVSIYVPSTMHDGPAPENVVNYYINDTLKKLSAMYGGATATTVFGSWYSQELNKLITEKITICYSFCDEYDQEKLVAICNNLKTVFEQETISLELSDQGLMFV